ncbi:MAG: phage tail protein [Cyanobacteria bacterium J06560_6]
MSVTTKPFLSLTLTPLQLPDTNLSAEGSTPWRQEKPSHHPEVVPHLRICPGEPSQLIAQIHNDSTQAWTFRLKVTASIPQAWCQPPTEALEVPGRASSTDSASTDSEQTSSAEAEITFRVPTDFFENHYALAPDSKPLKINYDGHIQVYARPSNAPESAEQLMATAPFKVLLRSHSRYLQYLPQVYREVDFIGRLLKLFEESFDPSVEMMKLMWAYLDPRTAPQQLLPFLAHWVGWPTELSTSHTSPVQVERQRQLIFNAMTLYRWRGTQQGLRHYLHLYTGLPETEQYIQIENTYRTGFELGKAKLNETTIIGGGKPYHFRVQLTAHPPQVSHQDLLDQEALIHTIIDQEKPAFCTYSLHIHSA